MRIRAATGRKTFVLRRRVDGAWRVETLGDWPKLTLLNARRRAARTPAASGAAIAFETAADEFYKGVIEPRYRTAPGEVRAYLTRDCKTLAKRRLDRLTLADYAEAVRTKAKTAPGAAVKMLSILKQFGKWAAISELVESDPTASLTARALHLPAYRARQRVLTADELKALWALPDEPYGRLLRFALLTGCRIGEARKLEPEQIVGNVWTIPITKNGKPHIVPLTATAAELATAGWPRRLYQSLHAYPVDRGAGWMPHDLRRTGATIMRDAGAPIEVIEAVLNHSPPRLVQVYQRPNMLPAMRKALEQLEAAVLAVVAK